MRIFTPLDELKICGRYARGESSRQIADSVYCSTTTILDILRRHNITPRGQRFPDSIRRAVIETYREHASFPAKTAAIKTGLTVRQTTDIAAWERRHGRL